MALTGVLRPGHVALRVLELEPAVKHYTEVLGLIETARDEQGRVFLKAWDEHDHHSVVLREADSPGDLRGMAPSRFDHCLLYGDDVDGTVKLFRDVLGFSLAEQVVAGPDGEVLIGAFLTCSNKAHDVAFIRHPEKNRFHHASFLLDNWSEVLKAADIISKKDVSLDIGPTRHGITRGATIYFFDPSGNRNEVFSGGYIHYPDKPTITWTDNELGKAIFYHDRKLNEAFLNVLT
ncbi:catechol 2,3 dioxygenase [compost metagenome]